MQSVCKPDPCCCPPVLVPTCPPPCPPSPQPQDASSKYYHEIGAEMIGNQLIIRMEKDKSKSKRKFDQWDPPCDCDIVEIQRPTKKEGPKILNGNNNDRILFRVRSKSHVASKDDYRPQAISYEIGSCKGGESANDGCRTITVYPQLGLAGSQEVHTDEITDGDQNICLLRVRKKPGDTQKIKRNIELELRTPRPPTPPSLPSPVCVKMPMKVDPKGSSNEVLKKETKKKKRGRGRRNRIVSNS